jgi:hypothetical protein
VPNLKEQGEADGEGEEAAHHHHKLVEGLWDFQRDNKQGDGEGDVSTGSLGSACFGTY